MGSGVSSPLHLHEGQFSKCICRAFPCICHEKGKQSIPVSANDIAYEIAKLGKIFQSDCDKIIGHNLGGQALEQITDVTSFKQTCNQVGITNTYHQLCLFEKLSGIKGISIVREDGDTEYIKEYYMRANLSLTKEVSAISWSTNGSHLAFAVGKDLHIWEALRGGTLIHTLKGHNEAVKMKHAVTLSPSLLDTSYRPSSPLHQSSPLLWRSSSMGNLMRTTYDQYGDTQQYSTAQLLSPTQLAQTGPIISLPTKPELQNPQRILFAAHKKKITCVRWSPDGVLIATGGISTPSLILSSPTIITHPFT